MRLNKYIASCGVCSRREADRLIEAKKIKVNDIVADTGMSVEESDRVFLDGKEIFPQKDSVVLAYYKPVGVVCTEKDRHADKTVIEDISFPERVTYAGRLDKDSEGLLIMTNDGKLIDAMMRGRNKHEKEYEVVVDKNISKEFLSKMSEGIYIKELDQMTRPCPVIKTGNNSFRIVLTQGLNRQIRRMCKSLGYKVTNLKRIRVMTVELNDYKLKPGEYIKLNNEEKNRLYSAAGLDA